MPMNITIVAGTFDGYGGAPSAWATSLASELTKIGVTVSSVNGGNLALLASTTASLPNEGILFWFTENSSQAELNAIKAAHPRLFLVTAQPDFTNRYAFLELVSLSLASKSNLLIEITGNVKKPLATVLDPLGNVYCYNEANVALVAAALYQRLNLITTVTREPTQSIGTAIAVHQSAELDEFIKLVNDQAKEFHKSITPNTARMLGNASFRCEAGFPSLKDGYDVFVSQRNIDKSSITKEGFIACTKVQPEVGDGYVGYFGTVKPSVDTPIQLELYSFYKNVKFMMHSHAFVDGAPTTSTAIPCGALEEVAEIKKLNSNPDAVDFCINLKGHGSLVLAGSVDFIKTVKWKARRLPEQG
jgi:hypothetical protein